MRARDLRISIGHMAPGEHNAITDVSGVRVGHTTLIQGEGPLQRGSGPIRTGVTVILPHGGDVWREPVYAGCHTLNGNGDLTGLEWIREAGLLGGVVGMTNTHSVGIVRDALVTADTAERDDADAYWSLPVVGETYDGTLNDINGHHVRPEHVETALQAAAPGPVAEGNVGGGTGMVCFEFKGGIGTASRVVPGDEGWTVGVLVQANFGRRDLLRIDGVPIGAAIPLEDVPSAWDQADGLHRERSLRTGAGGGSILVFVATDAPLLPHQCTRLAQRPTLALGRVGSTGANESGDLFLAWSTGNRGVSEYGARPGSRRTADVRTLVDSAIDGLFEATIEATEEAIVNAMLSAETMTGRDGITAYALPHDRVVELMDRHGRLRRPNPDQDGSKR